MPRSRDATKQRLLAAVRELFQRGGPDALGVNAIAVQAGVDKVLIYRYFGGISGLLEAYAQAPHHSATNPHPIAAEGSRQSADPARALARFLVAELQSARNDPLDLATRRAALDAASPIGRKARLDRAARVRAILDQMRTQHRIPNFLDAEAIILLLLGAVDHLALSGVTVTDDPDSTIDASWLRMERALERTARAVFGQSET